MSQMPSGINPNFEALHKRFPDLGLFARARAEATCRSFPSNTATPAPAPMSASRTTGRRFDAIKIVPRYGAITTVPPIDVELFGTPLRRADRHRADGRPVAGLAGRRSADGQGRAARARSLHARRRRRRHHRGGGESRARRVLAAALPFLPERSRHRLRPDQAGDRRGRQSAGAHHRRAGAHHALARKLCRPWRRIPPRRRA